MRNPFASLSNAVIKKSTVVSNIPFASLSLKRWRWT